MFKALTTTYLALLGIQLLKAVGVILFLQRNPGLGFEDIFPFAIVVPLLTLGGMVITFLINQNRTKQGHRSSFSGDQKMKHYRITVLLRSTILEGVNLFAVLAAMVTGNLGYMVFFGLGLLYFLYLKPSKRELEGQYALGGV